MRAAIYSPYLETLGGGERYIFSVAKVLGDNGWNVDVESKDSGILKKAEERFGLEIKNTKVIANVKRGDGYDLCFWLSDGSVPALRARKNFLHFQRPFYNVDGKSLISRMKFFRINKVIVNSDFTKKWIDKEYPVESVVLYPPVPVEKIKPGKKENLIIYVGRFSQLEQAKRQDILVSEFKKFYDFGFKDWKMILAGGSEVGRTNFVDKLKKSREGYPIEIIEKPSFKDLKDIYARAKLFWSGSGYGIDEEKDPGKVEHFGITAVEGMAGGAVPLLYDAGGHKEIVKNGENGYLWKRMNDLLKFSKRLAMDKELIKKISLNARKTAIKFGYEKFKKGVSDICLA